MDSLAHLRAIHDDADGYVALARRDEHGRWRQHHYRPSELARVLHDWTGLDVYFSQNTFYIPSRKVENIRQLRALYVDVDCHLFNLLPEYVVYELEQDWFRQRIPEPNIILYSGRGLALVWLIEPAPVQALPLWQAVQRYLLSQLREYGADARAADAARVLRIAGSINSKNGAVVRAQYRHDYRPLLREIAAEYLPPLSPRRGRPATRVGAISHRLFTVYSLHYARMMDLLKLCELRQWHMTGHRETTLFLYRYWNCCYLEDEEEALRHTIELNQQFTEPLSESEVIKATKSAERAYHARNDAEANRIAIEQGYPGAGYNISNAKLIEWLSITDDEQKHLQAIIGPNEKRRRNRVQAEAYRRCKGAIPRDEYTSRRREAAEERRQEAIRLRKLGLTQRQIADRLGVTQQAVSLMLRDTNL